MVMVDGWQQIRLGDVAAIARGGSPRPIQAFLTSNPDGINWIKIGDVKAGEKYITGTQERILEEGRSKSRDVHVGDLILSNSMSYGRPYILKIDGCIHDGWLVIQHYDSTFDQDYLFYALSSWDTFNQYRSMSAGSGVQNLSKDKVANVVILAPNREEQRAISSRLGELDELISCLSRLVDKQRTVRNALAASLLSGDIRLSGFSDSWDSSYLAQLGSVRKGAGISRDETGSGSIPCIRYGDIYTSYSAYAFETITGISRAVADKATALKYGDIVFACTGETKEDIGKCVAYMLDKTGYAGGDTQVLTPIPGIDPVFLSLLLNSQKIQTQKAALGQGDAVVHISGDSLKAIRLCLPSYEEQQAIAKVIIDFDREISATERKLEKYKQIRQGMMRELLTGHIRLVQE